MALTPDAVIDAFWQAVEELPDGAVSQPGMLRLLAGLCDHLGRVEPSERFAEEGRESRAAADLLGQLLTGSGVRLAYVYNALGDGFVELETFNAEGIEQGESGTVVGAPGVRVRFDAREARRAVQILGTMFPALGLSDPAEPGAAPDRGGGLRNETP